MRVELVLGCFYSPISGSPLEPIILSKNYTYFGIASTKNGKNQEIFADILSLLRVFVDYI